MPHQNTKTSLSRTLVWGMWDNTVKHFVCVSGRKVSNKSPDQGERFYTSCVLQLSLLSAHTSRVLLFNKTRQPVHQQTQHICITFIQCRTNVFDVGPALYKCYTNVLCTSHSASTMLSSTFQLSSLNLELTMAGHLFISVDLILIERRNFKM